MAQQQHINSTDETVHTEKDDILSCKSMQRIKTILTKFKPILQRNISNVCKDEVEQLITEIFTDNYTKTHLLNDFNHIKHNHNVDENDLLFAKCFEYLTNDPKTNCNYSTCKPIERHYQDRSKLSNQYILSDSKSNDDTVEFNHQYIIRLINSIHVYFIHSYDINRLTLNEIETINTLYGDDKIVKIADIMKHKKKPINISINNDKYIENKIECKFSIDIRAICQQLKHEN
eukprot:471491_1